MRLDKFSLGTQSNLLSRVELTTGTAYRGSDRLLVSLPSILTIWCPFFWKTGLCLERIQWMDGVTEWCSKGFKSWIWWFVLSVALLHLFYHLKFPGFLVGWCSWLTFLLFNSSFVLMSLQLLTVPCRQVTCMLVCPVKPHKMKINNRNVFYAGFSPSVGFPRNVNSQEKFAYQTLHCPSSS